MSITSLFGKCKNFISNTCVLLKGNDTSKGEDLHFGAIFFEDRGFLTYKL